MGGTVSFTVYGHPEPAGSKRAFKHPSTGAIIVTDANKKAKPWKQEVAGAAIEHIRRGDLTEILTGPLSLSVTFFFTRPKSHLGTGRNQDTVKPSAPGYPTVRPDTTKLLRGVEDALTGVLWRDDAQVVNQYAAKRYSRVERCEVTVSSVEAPAFEVAGEMAA